GQHGVTSFWRALAKLTAAGYSLAFDALWEEFDLGPDPRLAEKPAVVVPIDGKNYDRRYPPAGGAAALPAPVEEPPPSVQPVETVRQDESPAWDAFREIQRQTAEAHAAYQKSMAETHMAFLRAAEASSLRLAAMASGGAIPLGLAPPFDDPPLTFATPAFD